METLVPVPHQLVPVPTYSRAVVPVPNQSGTGTQVLWRTSADLVPVPHLLVPIPTCDLYRIQKEFQSWCEGTLVF